MLPVLALLFLAVPVAELAVIVTVADNVGVLNTLGVLVLVSVLGAWLVKREGLGVVRRVQRQMERGQVPGAALTDAFLIMLAGALMLTPGFLTDVLGLLLLFPPSRAVVRAHLHRRLAGHVTTTVLAGGAASPRDVGSVEIDRP